MVTRAQLISHRFRGFSDHENTIAGLKAALDFGAEIVEFDIRVTRCGVPVIYHDEYAPAADGSKHIIAETLWRDFPGLGGTFAHIPTADALFEAAAEHPNTAHLLIDIKDYGFETEIDALVRLYRLQDRATYVSWVPNVLYRMADIAPDIPLCLSHWCQNPPDFVRALHHVHDAQDGHIPRLPARYIHGERSGWFVDGPLKGELADQIERSGGSVCVPQAMVSHALIEAYHARNITVSTFSYVDWEHIRDHETRIGPDLYFIDARSVFEAL